MPSFRVRGKILATVPDDGHIRVMLAEDEIRAVVAEYPDLCAPSYWGKRLACVVVSLAPGHPNRSRGAANRSLAQQGAEGLDGTAFGARTPGSAVVLEYASGLWEPVVDVLAHSYDGVIDL
jgi:hypothetical protein